MGRSSPHLTSGASNRTTPVSNATGPEHPYVRGLPTSRVRRSPTPRSSQSVLRPCRIPDVSKMSPKLGRIVRIAVDVSERTESNKRSGFKPLAPEVARHHQLGIYAFEGSTPAASTFNTNPCRCHQGVVPLRSVGGVGAARRQQRIMGRSRVSATTQNGVAPTSLYRRRPIMPTSASRKYRRS